MSVGMIGGADGPTVVFLSGSLVSLGVLLAAAAAGIGLWLLRRRKK